MSQLCARSIGGLPVACRRPLSSGASLTPSLGSVPRCCLLSPTPDATIATDADVDRNMASLADFKEPLDAQKTEFVSSVTEEFASMKAELAKELRQELHDSIQAEIATTTPASDGRRKQARTTDD